MKNLKYYKDYQKVDESKLSKKLMISSIGFLTQLNLLPQDKNAEQILIDQLNKNITQEDLKMWEHHSQICYQLNCGIIEYSELSEEEKTNILFNTSPLLTIDSKSIKDSTIQLIGDQNLTINLSSDKNEIEITESEIIKEDLIELDTFVLDQLNLDINTTNQIVNTQIDLDLKFKVDKILHSPQINLNLTPSYFTPKMTSIRLVDDIIKTTLELERVKISTTLGFFDKKLRPGTKSIGFQFIF
jgi:hypothetical protein